MNIQLVEFMDVRVRLMVTHVVNIERDSNEFRIDTDFSARLPVGCGIGVRMLLPALGPDLNPKYERACRL